ncbi:MAG: hypothetical protein IJK39_02005 [Bacteroidales bacterium]|nr:hypothetical protein [Bacteroidales bacterium]
MKTNTIYTALVATIATVLTFTATSVASAQSSSRRNNSGGNTTATQRSSDTRQKAAQVSQPRANNNNSVQDRRTVNTQDRKTSTPQNRTTVTNKNTSSSDRNATISRRDNSGVNTGRNYNDHMGNVRTQSGIETRGKDNRPNNGNVTNNRPDNKPNNNRPDVHPDNKPNNKPNNNRTEPDRKPNGNITHRPGTDGPRPTYYAGRGGNSASKLPPAPRFDRANPNRHLGYNPFRDGRIIHRPAPIHIYYDYGYRYDVRPRIYYKYRINGMSMYFWGGVWYWHAYGYYNVHRPPVGTRIPISDIAPYLYEVDYDFYSGIHTRTYYVDSYANFYVQVNSYELQVVNAPDGAVLYDMPSDYREIVYDGSVYYVIGNSIFEYVYSNANSWYFRAVGIYR